MPNANANANANANIYKLYTTQHYSAHSTQHTDFRPYLTGLVLY
jgi:hypothetical protein